MGIVILSVVDHKRGLDEIDVRRVRAAGEKRGVNTCFI
jgi:hypothetical protein